LLRGLLRIQILESFVTAKAHGTGMGVAITRSIVEAQGGEAGEWPFQRLVRSLA
jgi:nitrogen fixation/metabolism regulation signal transduction histidine kinase